MFKGFSMSGPPRCLAKPRGASQCAGVSPLRVLDDSFINPSLVLLLERLRPFLRRLRGGRRPPDCWAIFRTFLQIFTFFRIFFAFWAHLKPSLHFLSIFFDFSSILGRFWMDFGKVWERFFEDFSHFLENRRSSKFVRPRSVS